MKRVTHAWPALLAMLLCSFLAAPAGADVKSVRSTGSGSVSITIESFSVPNGPNRLGTSALGCNIVVPITTIGRSTEDAMRIRNALANSSAGNPLNGYTFAIAGGEAASESRTTLAVLSGTKPPACALNCTWKPDRTAPSACQPPDHAAPREKRHPTAEQQERRESDPPRTDRRGWRVQRDRRWVRHLGPVGETDNRQAEIRAPSDLKDLPARGNRGAVPVHGQACIHDAVELRRRDLP